MDGTRYRPGNVNKSGSAGVILTSGSQSKLSLPCQFGRYWMAGTDLSVEFTAGYAARRIQR